MEWLKQVTRLAAIEDLPITWSTPSGFQVIQAYREVTTRRIETKMNEGIVKLSLQEEGQRLNRRRQKSVVLLTIFIHWIVQQWHLLLVR